MSKVIVKSRDRKKIGKDLAEIEKMLSFINEKNVLYKQLVEKKTLLSKELRESMMKPLSVKK